MKAAMKTKGYNFLSLNEGILYLLDIITLICFALSNCISMLRSVLPLLLRLRQLFSMTYYIFQRLTL
jgi:hypothetical protein